MTKKISLANNRGIALVDDEDFEYLNQYKWHLHSGGYVAACVWAKNNRNLYMHRLIMKTPAGMQTDHINHNKLDNRKENLRICTSTENNQNRQLTNKNKSGYKGVSFFPSGRKWTAHINANRYQRNLGLFSTPEEAALAYDAAAIQLHGKFAKLNFSKNGKE